MTASALKTLDLDGTAVPVLGFGTYKLNGRACRDGVADALALGYRHIDTAQIYENEIEVGEGLRQSGVLRADVFLTTKVWHTALRPDDVARTAEESLRRLGTDYVDLLLVHWPSPAVPLADTLGAFERLREAGKTRFIGVSNFPAALLVEAFEHADVRCNQVEYHVLLDQSPLVGLMRARGGMLTAYRPLAGGTLAAEPVVEEIARAHGATASQVALAWLLAQDGVSAIPKAASSEHRRANLAALEIALSGDERDALKTLARTRNRRFVNPDIAPVWDAPSA